MARQKRSLQRVLLYIILIPAGVITLILLSVIVLSATLLKSEIDQRQNLLIDALTHQGNQYLAETDRLMRTLAAGMRDLSPSEQLALLQTARRNYPQFSDFYLLDETGRVNVEDTDATSLLNLDLSGMDYFRHARDDDASSYFSEPFISPTTGRVAVTTAAPVKNDQSFRGVLVGELDLQALQHTIEQFSTSKDDLSFIVDPHGLLVAHTYHDWVQQQRNLANLPLIQHSLRGQSTTEVYFDEELGEWVVGSTTPMDQHWAVATVQPLREAAQPLIILIFVTLLALGISWLLFRLFQLYSARRITDPIGQLVSKADALARGEYQVLPVAPTDAFREIDSLGLSFTRMVEAVRERDRWLEQRVRDRTRRLAFVATLGERINTVLDPDELLHVVVTTIWDAFEYYAVCIFLLDDQRQFLKLNAVAGAADDAPLLKAIPLPVTTGRYVVTCAARLGRVFVLENAQAEPDLQPYAGLPETRSEIGVPFMVEDRVRGVLSACERRPQAFDASSTDMFRSLANQVGVALHNAYLYKKMESLVEQRTAQLVTTNALLQTELVERRRAEEALRQSAERLATLHEVDQAILSAQSIDAIAQAALRHFQQILPRRNSRVLLFEGEEAVEMAAYRHGQARPTGARLPRAALGGTAALAAERVYRVGDLRQLADPAPQEQELLLNDARSMLTVSLIVQGDSIGLLSLDAAEAQAFPDELVEIAREVADQLAVALQNARLLAQTQQHAATLEQRVAERTRELAEANAQLTELDQMKSKFVADVSHELRTPIANLKLYIDLLEQGRPDKRQTYMEVLRQQVRRVMALVDNILDLSRLERRQQQGGRFEPVALNTVVEQVVTAHQPRAEATGLHLSFAPGPAVPAVMGDANQLSQVATNLVANALNYTVYGTVAVSTACRDGQVLLQVADTGRGIASEDLPRIFERFYRGEQVNKNNIPGTGLGLAIVKEIVEMHQGRIEVDSRLEGGTVFTVSLPVVQPSSHF